tara:strand:- start:1757 stop:3301 length:1545 start_codon:yes stop_codon:yes gene_type:complete
MAVQCIWFKRDLRIHDHAALQAAAKQGPVIAVYVLEPAILQAPDFDALHWNFIADCLRDLQKNLSHMGLELIIRSGDALSVLQALHTRYAFEAIWAHQETGNAISYRRDLAVHKWARDRGIAFYEPAQNGVVRRLAQRDRWSRQWEAFMSAPISRLPQKILAAKEPVEFSQIPTASALRIRSASERQVVLKGGESAAWDCLESFIEQRGRRYHREMSSPNTAYNSCSRLSAYLTWGCISMRSVVQAVRLAAAEGRLPKVAARAFLSRCHWHCHFMQKLECEPAIEFKAFNAACDRLRSGPVDRHKLHAWQAGRTGYPFVDACMRALKAQGWINFRMRAMLVSFAAYHLWLDWRSFRDWLACQFIDYEPGIHFSQIQMQSGSTGINAIRIYNPIKQGFDQDPDGIFIRKWVPELSHLKGAAVHCPWQDADLFTADLHGQQPLGYPSPIVDHTVAVRAARLHFSALRKSEDYWQEAKVVMQRHGSRRGRQKAASRSSDQSNEQGEFSFSAPVAPSD